MKLKIISIIVLCVALITSAWAQPSLVWQKCLGGIDFEQTQALVLSSSNEIICANFSQSIDGDVTTGNLGMADIWITKQDLDGNLIWQTSFGGNGADLPFGIQLCSDGGFVIIGSTQSADLNGFHGNHDGLVIKFNSLGLVEWYKCLGGTDVESFKSIKQLADGGFVVVGNARSLNGNVAENFGMSDDWVVRLDNFGNIVWEKSFGGESDDGLEDVELLSNGDFALVGSSRSSSIPGYHLGVSPFYTDFHVIRSNSNGDLIWEKCYGGSDEDIAYSVEIGQLDNLLISGASKSIDGDFNAWRGNYDIELLELDSTGNILGSNSFGGSSYDFAHDLKLNSNGTILISGLTQSNDIDVSGFHGGSDLWLIQIDLNHQLDWQLCLGGSGHEGATANIFKQNQAIYLAGSSNSNDGDVSGNHFHPAGVYYDDAWILKLNDINEDFDGDGFTVADGDCDDTNASVNPNATELCNGIDDNCNTQVDEGFDLDADTFTICNGDCDDTNALIYPGAPEVLDSLDNNCDGQIDEGFNPDPDADGDGFSLSEGDCNDADPNVNPGATELCNGVDDNCNSIIDEGFDLDGDGETSCEGDCNDNDSLVNTSAIELCNSIDDNCDTFINEGLDCDEVTIQIPNGISPNGDGFNDAWYLPWLNGMTDYSIVISNRWGQVIFQTNDYSTPWDGTYLGNSLPAADYFYVIKLSDNTIYEGVISIKY